MNENVADETAEAMCAHLADACVDANYIDGLFVLSMSEPWLSFESSDFGQDYHQLILTIPAGIVRSIDSKSVEGQLWDFATGIREFRRNEFLNGIKLQPKLEFRANWREDVKSFLRGDGVSNQGRVRSDNYAPLEHHGLRFRSKAEIFLCEALRERNIPYAPLTVFLRGDGTYRRIEPDYTLIYKGRVCIIEIDGPQHRETPVEADERVDFLTRNRAEVKRIRHSDCDTPEKAIRALADAMRFFDSRLG